MADFDSVAGDGRVRVEGLSRTLRALSKAGADAQDMRDLMHRIGLQVIAAARPPVLTGKTKASMRAGRGKTKAVVRAGGRAAPGAAVVHYGWPAHNIAPNPWLTQAVQSQRGAALAELDAGLDAILRKNNLK